MKKQQQTPHSFSRPILSHPSYHLPTPPQPSTSQTAPIQPLHQGQKETQFTLSSSSATF